MVTARIAGVVFEEWPSNFGRCYLIGRNGLKGWRGGDVRREEIVRPAAHGAFNMPGFQAQRVISLSGTLLASSPAELRHMKDTVSGVLSDGGTGRLTVEDEDGDTWRDVGLVSCAPPDDLDDTSATFAFTFWAADPRRYGEVHEFAAGQEAVQYGNFPATPRLLVGAGSGGYTVTGPDGRRVVVSSAPSGAHEIDFVSGGLFVSGVRQVGAVSIYQPWTVPPGLPGVVARISGSRTLVQRVTDTFV